MQKKIILLGAIGVFWGLGGQSGHAKDGYTALKEVLEEPGEARIELNENIEIRGRITVRGTKQIVGNGYRITRGKIAGNAYGGTLFCIADGKLSVTGVVVSGYVKGTDKRIYGRLVDVGSGVFVLGNGSVLKNNCYTGRGEDGGGAVVVGNSGTFVMKSGKISGNSTATEGAAVRVEKGGSFQMRGGIIKNNISEGIGEIEGFDGRGGAVYNAGNTRIISGVFKGNQAAGYEKGDAVYGGVGGAFYNTGELVIAGGIFLYNSASSGGGVLYGDENSSVHINAGSFRDNQADRGRTVFLKGGSCFLDVPFNEGDLYAEGECRIKGLSQSEPEKPKEKPEEEKGKTQRAGGGMGRNGKDKKNAGEKEDAEGEKLAGESGAVRFKAEGRRVYYVGEKLGNEELMYGISAERDGKDVTGRIYLAGVIWDKPEAGLDRAGPKGSFLPLDTKREASGKLVFALRSGNKGKNRWTVPFQIVGNHAPQIQTAQRYLFAWEVKGVSGKRLKKLLFEGIALKDREDSVLDLWEEASIDWNGFTRAEEGKCEVEVRLRDQTGHRFYMGEKEKRRYGCGRVCTIKIPITLVAEGNGGGEKGVIRFQGIYGSADGKAEEVWHFSARTLGEIQAYMGERDDPFSEDANEQFLVRFGRAGTSRLPVSEP